MARQFQSGNVCIIDAMLHQRISSKELVFHTLESCKALRMCTSWFDTSLCLHSLASHGRGETNTTWFSGGDTEALLHTTSLYLTCLSLCLCILSVFTCAASPWTMAFMTELEGIEEKITQWQNWTELNWSPELRNFNGTSVCGDNWDPHNYNNLIQFILEDIS